MTLEKAQTLNFTECKSALTQIFIQYVNTFRNKIKQKQLSSIKNNYRKRKEKWKMQKNIWGKNKRRNLQFSKSSKFGKNFCLEMVARQISPDFKP